jgi:hypothetical protein
MYKIDDCIHHYTDHRSSDCHSTMSSINQNIPTLKRDIIRELKHERKEFETAIRILKERHARELLEAKAEVTKERHARELLEAKAEVLEANAKAEVLEAKVEAVEERHVRELTQKDNDILKLRLQMAGIEF